MSFLDQSRRSNFINMGKPANSDPKLEAILSPVLPSLKRFLEKQGLVGYNSESNHQTILPILKIFKMPIWMVLLMVIVVCPTFG